MPYIGDILPEDPDATFDPHTDILEIIGDEQPGGGDTFALEAGNASLVYLIDWKKSRSFIRWCLGFSYADEGDPFKLRRENPQPHPRFPWLTAASVHFSAIAPESNTDSGIPEGAPNFPAVYLDEDIRKTGFYQKCYATIQFADRMWTFRPDNFIATHSDELYRNAYFDPVPQVDLLQAEGGQSQLKWVQGDADRTTATANKKPLIGDVIANLFATQVARVTLTLNWMWVPESYLSNNPLLFLPSKLFAGISKVNNAPFAGFPAGTILMQAPAMQRFRFPVATFDGLHPFYGWNIRIPFTYFNPTLGVPDDGADATPRGHRTMPWRQSLKWFGAKRDFDAQTIYLLEETDLNDILKHIDAP